MAKKKKNLSAFEQRITTTSPDGIKITRAVRKTPKTPVKHYVGADHKPTPEEALEMGRQLFDAIQTERAQSSRR